MQPTLDQLEEKFTIFMEDARKRVNQNNKAAGTRSRVAITPVVNLMKEWRKKSM